MGLNLKTLRTKGRAEKLPIPIAIEPLTVAEVEAATSREVGIKPQPLARLSSRHRQIAKAVASGATPNDIAGRFGLSISRISILKHDPTFADQVRFFQLAEDDHFGLVHDAMAGLALDAVEEVRTRLEESPEDIETSELTKLIQITTDRTGHAPKRVEEKTVNFNFGDRLAAARERVREAATLELKAEEVSAQGE